MIHRSRSDHRSRSGSSLIEVSISVMVIAILMGVISESLTTSRDAYGQGMTSADVESLARRTLDGIATRMIGASASTLNIDNPAPPAAPNVVTWLDFRPVVGYAGGPQLDPLSRIQLELYPNELDDGIDNNGNGLIDECRLVYLPDVVAGAPVVGLAGFVRRLAEGELPNGLDDNGDGNIDEPGFQATWEPLAAAATGSRGGRLTLQITLERSSGGPTRVLRSVQTLVRVRSQ